MDPVSAFSVESEDEIKNVRLQLKALSNRTSKKVELLRDMNEFFARQAEIELQYARQLEGLHSKFIKPRSERGAVANVAKALRRPTQDGEENEATSSRVDNEAHGQVMDVWHVLLEQMRKRADARQRFATNLADEMKSHLDCLERESVATSKRCLELGGHIQLELQRSFKQVEETLKTYHTSQGKCLKVEESWGKAKEKGQIKKGEKMKEKAVAAEKKAVAARNEYVLSLHAANACKKRYYKREIDKLVDAMDKHFHSTFRYVFKIFRDLSMQAEAIVTKSIGTVYDTASHVSAKAEKEKFFKDHAVYFMDRRMFDFVPFRQDEEMVVQSTPDTLSDLISRYQDLEAMVAKLDHQIREEKKTLRTIGVLRREIGYSVKTNDDGVPKCVENANMYTECYSRLVLKKVHKASLVSQLKILAEALGPNKPATSHSYSDELSGSDEMDEEEELDILQSSLKGGTRRTSLTHRTSTSSLPIEAANGSGQGTATHTPDAASLRSRSGSAASTFSAQPEEPRSRRNTANASAAATAATAAQGEDIGGKGDKDSGTSGSSTLSSAHPSVRRPAPAPPGPPAGRSSPRLGRSARRGKRPERPPDPKRGPTTSGRARTSSKPPAQPPATATSAGAASGKTTPKAAPRRPPRPTPTKPPRPDLPAGSSVERLSPAASGAYKFGGVLESMAKLSNRTVPVIVESCIRAVREHGLDEEGIFRVPGSSLQIDELKESFERGQDPLANGVPSHVDPAAIAGLLKLFLRELADPVMTQDNYSLLIQIGNVPDKQKRLQGLRRVVQERLPEPNRRVLELLMPFLHEVTEHEAQNKMGVSNLALVFGPTLMPAPKDDMGAMLRDATTVNTIMSCLIEHHDWIFSSTPSPSGGGSSNHAEAAAPGSAANKDTGHDSAKSQEESRQDEPRTAPVPKKRKPATKPLTCAKALHDYSGRNASELSFEKGTRITIHEKTDPNWWKGELNGKKGYVAAAYVRDIGLQDDKDEEKRQQKQKRDATSTVAAANGQTKERTRSDSAPKPGTAPKPQKKVPPAVRPRTKSTTSMKMKMDEQPPKVQEAGPVAPPRAVPRPEPTKQTHKTESGPSTRGETEPAMDLDARADAASRSTPAHKSASSAAAVRSRHGDEEEDDDDDVGYLDIGEVQARRATLSSERSPDMPPPPPPPADDSHANASANANVGGGDDGQLTFVRSRTGTDASRSPRHISLDMTMDAATTDGDGAEPSAPPPPPPVDYDDDDDSTDDEGEGEDDGDHGGGVFGDDDGDGPHTPLTAKAVAKQQLSTSTASLQTPAETPAPPDGAQSRLFETRASSISSMGGSRMSRAMSFGPTFAPPPPPPADDEAEDNADEQGDDDALLPPPPPPGQAPTAAAGADDDDDDDDDLPPPPPPADDFLDLPPPPAPDA